MTTQHLKIGAEVTFKYGKEYDGKIVDIEPGPKTVYVVEYTNGYSKETKGLTATEISAVRVNGKWVDL